MSTSLTSHVVKQRESGIELFRIIAMLLIVAHHYVVNSDVAQLFGGDYMKDLFYYFFGMWGKTGINCFVLITGYFMCKSNITLRKFLKLFLEIIFYKITIYLILAVTGYYTISLHSLIDIWPIGSVSTGFVSCFLLFYLCIPFLNILIKNLNLKQHALLILLTLSIYTFIGSIPLFHVRMNYVTWFSVLYIISSFMRFYADKVSILAKARWGILSILSIVMSMCSVALLAWYKKDTQTIYYFISDSNKVLALITTLCTFMYFKNLGIHFSKMINTIAASTFGVLLIHAHSNEMRQWLWKDFIDVKSHYVIDNYALFSIIVVLAIFIVCTIIDFIRIHTIEKYTFKIIDKHLPSYHIFSK